MREKRGLLWVLVCVIGLVLMVGGCGGSSSSSAVSSYSPTENTLEGMDTLVIKHLYNLDRKVANAAIGKDSVQLLTDGIKIQNLKTLSITVNDNIKIIPTKYDDHSIYFLWPSIEKQGIVSLDLSFSNLSGEDMGLSIDVMNLRQDSAIISTYAYNDGTLVIQGNNLDPNLDLCINGQKITATVSTNSPTEIRYSVPPNLPCGPMYLSKGLTPTSNSLIFMGYKFIKGRTPFSLPRGQQYYASWSIFEVPIDDITQEFDVPIASYGDSLVFITTGEERRPVLSYLADHNDTVLDFNSTNTAISLIWISINQNYPYQSAEFLSLRRQLSQLVATSSLASFIETKILGGGNSDYFEDEEVIRLVIAGAEEIDGSSNNRSIHPLHSTGKVTFDATRDSGQGDVLVNVTPDGRLFIKNNTRLGMIFQLEQLDINGAMPKMLMPYSDNTKIDYKSEKLFPALFALTGETSSYRLTLLTNGVLGFDELTAEEKRLYGLFLGSENPTQVLQIISRLSSLVPYSSEVAWRYSLMKVIFNSNLSQKERQILTKQIARAYQSEIKSLAIESISEEILSRLPSNVLKLVEIAKTGVKLHKMQEVVVKIAVESVEQNFAFIETSSKIVYLINCVSSEEIIISPSELTLTLGGTAQLVAERGGENITNQVFWSSSPLGIVNIDQEGVVTTLKGGIAEVTAEDRNGKKSTNICIVNVTGGSLTLEPPTLSVAKGSTYQLIVKTTPENATIGSMSWSNSALNEGLNIVNVDLNGKITALNVGKSTITLSAEVNGQHHTAACFVTVVEGINNFTLEPNSLSLKVGDVSQQLVAKHNGTAVSVNEWKSSNESVAIVNNNGVVTATGVGGASITASYYAGSNIGTLRAVCDVTVKNVDAPPLPPIDILLSKIVGLWEVTSWQLIDSDYPGQVSTLIEPATVRFQGAKFGDTTCILSTTGTVKLTSHTMIDWVLNHDYVIAGSSLVQIRDIPNGFKNNKVVFPSEGIMNVTLIHDVPIREAPELGGGSHIARFNENIALRRIGD